MRHYTVSYFETYTLIENNHEEFFMIFLEFLLYNFVRGIKKGLCWAPISGGERHDYLLDVYPVA